MGTAPQGVLDARRWPALAGEAAMPDPKRIVPARAGKSARC